LTKTEVKKNSIKLNNRVGDGLQKPRGFHKKPTNIQGTTSKAWVAWEVASSSSSHLIFLLEESVDILIFVIFYRLRNKLTLASSSISSRLLSLIKSIQGLQDLQWVQ